MLVHSFCTPPGWGGGRLCAEPKSFEIFYARTVQLAQKMEKEWIGGEMLV